MPRDPVPQTGQNRLVVFSDDWGRHPSSAQHLIRHLLPRYHVDWVNTVGTHRPRLSRADLLRGMEKLKGWLRSSETEEMANEGAGPAPAVHAPVHWPGFKTAAERAANRLLLGRALGPLLRSDPRPAAVVTTVPITADLAKATGDLNWVYYCVDDFSEWPGLDGETLRKLEHALLRQVGTVVCASTVLRDRIAGLGRQAHLLTHGIDLEHWRGVTRRPLCDGARRPVAAYWGHADRRLDPEICLALAEICDLQMIGRREDVDSKFADHPAITWTGPVPYARLPALAAEMDVLVMPYADLPVTRAMQPLKLKEYLATGLPVVATPLPANLAWADAMDVTADPTEFAELCVKRAGMPLPEDQATARGRLAAEGWNHKAAQFEHWITGR